MHRTSEICAVAHSQAVTHILDKTYVRCSVRPHRAVSLLRKVSRKMWTEKVFFFGKYPHHTRRSHDGPCWPSDICRLLPSSRCVFSSVLCCSLTLWLGGFLCSGLVCAVPFALFIALPLTHESSGSARFGPERQLPCVAAHQAQPQQHHPLSALVRDVRRSWACAVWVCSLPACCEPWTQSHPSDS